MIELHVVQFVPSLRKRMHERLWNSGIAAVVDPIATPDQADGVGGTAQFGVVVG